VTGSGDIAPADSGAGGSSPTGALTTGLTISLIVMVVVAAMFITAEYRRGLIRLTLAASPRRGRVLAAKALVIGLVTFVAGLVAIVVTVPVTEQLLRANGNVISPASALTLLRVEAGTAAVLALATVLAVALGTMLRSSAGAVAAAIAVIVLPYILGTIPGILPSGASDWLLRVTPAAAFAIQQVVPSYPQVSGNYTPFNNYYPLPPWGGFAVLCAWTAAALIAAVVLLRRRDA
jgi:ABC-type transport system involved in multi-copper enzyme maturation permease subunit